MTAWSEAARKMVMWHKEFAQFSLNKYLHTKLYMTLTFHDNFETFNNCLQLWKFWGRICSNYTKKNVPTCIRSTESTFAAHMHTAAAAVFDNLLQI